MNDCPQVVVTNWIEPELAAPLEAAGCRVVLNDTAAPWPEDLRRRHAASADALIAFMPDRIDAAFLAGCPRLKIVAGALKGYDNLDAEACSHRGIWLTVVPDLLTEPTAELTLGLMIALARHLLSGDARVRTGDFQGWRPTLYGGSLAGATVGILGMGAVGRAIAARLPGFRPARLLYHDATRRLPSDQERALGAAPASFDEILAASDFLVLALPLTDTTRHLIGADALRRLKPGCRLINPARGSLVDEAAVAAALEQGRLAGYAADVFELEDWARPDRPYSIPPALLAQRDRTVFTPHLGSAVDSVRRQIAQAAVDSVLDCLAGRTPRGAVNRPC